MSQNTRALKQLPFAGKKTVPAALRRDLWTPLCVLSFPNSHQGLSAYRKLREFKHLHEVAYPLSLVTQKDGPHAGNLMSKKEKSRIIMDQKANAIADMAAVLAIQARQPSAEEIAKANRRVNSRKGVPKPKYGLGSWETSDVLEFQGKVDGVSVWWANPTDAEYAETWPEPVRHGPLAVARYTAVWPPPEELLLGKKLLDYDPEVQDSQEADEVQDPAKPSKFNLFGAFGSKK